MKNTQWKWIASCAGACLLAASVWAQGDYGTPSSTDSSRTSSRQSGKSRQFCRAKDLIGADVKDSAGQKVGDLDEVFVNPQNGQTLAAVSLGGRRHAIVPIQAFNVTPGRGAFSGTQVTVNKSKSDLESGPSISGNQWEKLDDSTFTQSVYSHFGIQAPTAMGGAESPGGVSTGSDTNSMTPRSLEP